MALTAVAHRGVPLYSPKADVRSLVPRGELGPGFASVLNLYRAEGGEVILFGKPSARIYVRCRNLLDPIDEPRIGVIGDQFPSDIIGPQTAGMAPILVGTGAGGLTGSSPGALAAWQVELQRMCASYEISELTAMPGLVW
jgi:ribonucleotide monophosphatase NagD (HAD superfamily)